MRDTAVSYLRKKLGSPVSIQEFRMKGFTVVTLKGVSLEDRRHQPLLYSGSLKIRYELLPLLRGELVIHNLQWRDVRVNLYRGPADTAFNDQFILDAFGEGAAQTDTSSGGSSFTYRLDSIQLSAFSVQFNDAPGGVTARLNFDTIGVRPALIAPERMHFSVHDLLVRGLHGVVRIGTSHLPADTTAGAPEGTSSPLPVLAFGKIAVQQSDLLFEDTPGGFGATDTLGSVIVGGLRADLATRRISADSLVMAGVYSAIRLSGVRDTSFEAPSRPDTASGGYAIRGGLISLRDTRFRMDELGEPATHYKHAIDFNHLFVDSLDAGMRDVVFSADTLKGSVDHLSLREKSGFLIRQFHSAVWYDPTRISLDGLLLVTNNSRLEDTLEVRVPSWSTLADHLNDMWLHVHLTGCRLDASEALYFAPELAGDPSLKPVFDKIVLLDAGLLGKLSDLRIAQGQFSDNVGNLIRLKGRIENAGAPDSLLLDIVLQALRTGNRPIRSWLAPGTLPPDIHLPEQLSVRGPLKAGKTLVQTDLQIRSSDGNIRLKADMRHYLDSILASYDIAFKAEQVSAGKLTGDTALGLISASGTLRGRGWAPRSMEATSSVQVSLLGYNHYAYQGISLGGRINKTDYSLYAHSKDTAVTFDLGLRGSLDSGHTFVQGDLVMPKVDLYATHWYQSPLEVAGNILVRLADVDPYHLRGNILMDSLHLVTDSMAVALDTVSLEASDSLGVQSIVFDAPFAAVTATGHYDYTHVFQRLGRLISYHLQAPDSSRVPDTVLPGQQVDIAGQLTWPASLRRLLPTFSLPGPAAFMMHANTDSFLVSGHWHVPVLAYDDLTLDSLAGDLAVNRDSLAVRVTLRRLLHPRFPLDQTMLGVSASKGVINTALSLLDGAGKPKYELGGGVIRRGANGYLIHINPMLLLNRQRWIVPEDNSISLSDGKLKEANLSLTHGAQELGLTMEPDSTATPEIRLSLKQFQLSSLTTILANDTALAGGLLGGTATLADWDQSPRLQANLQIDSLQVMGSKLGDLTVKASNKNADDYTVDLALKGAGNQVLLQGVYHKASDQPLDFKLQLQPLALSSLQPFTTGYVEKLTGNLNGDLTIRGSAARPRILGDLVFRRAGFNPTLVNSNFRLYQEHVRFEDDGIHLDNFVLSDSANNEAVINGTILTRDYRRYRFNLNLQATDFEVLGPKQSADQLFYGPAFIDSRISVRGTPEMPNINMNLTLKDKSQVTFAIPESEPGIEEREGVVKFIDPNHLNDTSRAEAVPVIRARKPVRGMEFSGNLEVTPAAGIRIIIDQQNGDNLYVKGAASLNTTMDRGGNLLLTGQYEIQSGKYEMSLNQLIKRSFDIQKGSTITWEGEPTRAQVNITALYRADAPAIDLVSDQLSNATPEMRTRFKQKEPIQVFLIIKGDMLKPDISFRLDMPEDHQNDLDGTIYTRLKQINLIPSELNKQVMGLLVLNSFIPDNPMDILNNGSGGGLEQTARQSVSKILSQQLNNLAASLIKGVDLNFDLQSQQDYSTGNAQNSTTLNVGVSKHLFNDRLTVSVGNDFSLEGNSREASGIAGNVSIEYALTKDGRYRLSAYRKNNNEEIIQGQVVETGLTFSLVMDYNKFREIFAKVKKEQRLELRKAKRKK